MAGTRPEEPEAVAAQPLEVLSGLEALARVERTICRNAVSWDPSTAEGYALAGSRSASLPNGAPTSAAAGVAVAGASCVHHVDGSVNAGQAGAFELAAASVQEAIDQSLLAHLLSKRIGRPGLCSLGSSVAADLTLVRLPARRLIDELMETNSVVPETGADADRIVELAQEAARVVSEGTGRSTKLVERAGSGQAALLLVGSGIDAARCREAARILSEAGIESAALSVNLVRPFPEAAVREALSSAETVLVVEPHAPCGALLTAVRAAAHGKLEVRSVESAPIEALLESVATNLPKGAFDPARHPQTEAPLGRRLVVAPAGAWGEETVRVAVSVLGQLVPLRLAPRTREHLGATVLVWGSDALVDEESDLLLASHPALLEQSGALGLARARGKVLVLSGAESSEELARAISPASRAALHERALDVRWVNPPDPDECDGDEDADLAASFTLAGAVLQTLGIPDEPAGRSAVEVAASRLEALGRSGAARWLRSGAEHVRSIDPEQLDPSRHVEEIDFRTVTTLPLMPEPAEDPEQRARWAQRIRRFHWTGKGAFSPGTGLPVRPAVLESLSESLRETSCQPFALVQTEDASQPIVGRGLRDLLGQECESGAGRTLSDNIDRLSPLAERLLGRGGPGPALDKLVAEAGRALAQELDLGEEEEKSLSGNVEELCTKLPKGTVMDLRTDTPVRVYLAVLQAVRGPLRQRFEAELKRLRERLSDLLEIDRLSSSEGKAPSSLAATLGSTGAAYLDTAALAQTLAGEQAGPERLEPERRERIQSALSTIESYLEGQERVPQVVFLRPPDLDLPLPNGEQREHPNPLGAAVGVFDGLAGRMGRVFQAARVARREALGEQIPELPAGAEAELDWQTLTAEELLVLPAVTVVTTGRRLRQRDQRALSDLLRSSRPLHVIVQDEVGAPDEAEDLSRFHVDLGYLVVAHREAYAFGTTLARPDRATEALVRMARALRPAVALMRIPAEHPAPWRGLLAEAALQGRVCPDFRYDPDAGPSWADRYDLDGNPQPEHSWPLHSVAFTRNGSDESLEVPFTFADAVALEPAYLRHLRIIPPEAWDDAQVPLGEYLERFGPEKRERGIPYVWVLDEERNLQRAVVTRELAAACLDRLRTWRVLQELAGYENVFAERAAARARDEALAEVEAQRAEQDQAHADEIERVRTETARESIERLASALLSPEGLAIAPAAPRAAAAPQPVAAEVPSGAPAAEAALVEEAPAEEEVLAFDDPFIDSALCTTCNECTNLNGRLFLYNADKQAYLGDVAAGTFEQLVRGAELCPAKCIHPGKPRAGDATGTPELIERAAKFN